MTVNALSQGIKLSDNGNISYYGTLMSAYNAIVDGTNAAILLASGSQTETIVFDKNYRVTLAGGYDQTLSAVTGVTTLHEINRVTFVE